MNSTTPGTFLPLLAPVLGPVLLLG